MCARISLINLLIIPSVLWGYCKFIYLLEASHSPCGSCWLEPLPSFRNSYRLSGALAPRRRPLLLARPGAGRGGTCSSLCLLLPSVPATSALLPLLPVEDLVRWGPLLGWRGVTRWGLPCLLLADACGVLPGKPWKGIFLVFFFNFTKPKSRHYQDV